MLSPLPKDVLKKVNARGEQGLLGKKKKKTRTWKKEMGSAWKGSRPGQVQPHLRGSGATAGPPQKVQFHRPQEGAPGGCLLDPSTDREMRPREGVFLIHTS